MTTNIEILSAPSGVASTPARQLSSIALWSVQGVLAAVFAFAGGTKSFASLDRVHSLMPWSPDVPPALLRFTGTMELLAALGLVLPSLLRVRPRLTGFAALGLVVVMILASIFHALRCELAGIAINAVLAALAAFVAWGRLRGTTLGGRA